ncbi:MAG: P-loop NTPase [Acidobacteriota bacterium]|nr:P-loop NTPase [Acidobacteriota bacterium]
MSLRVLDRHLAKAGWFDAPDDPPWRLGKHRRSGAAICAFYSFKGGVGRSTALAAAALHFAAGGDRVVVLDADLDSPGVGSLLHGHDRTVADVGLVDYLLEAPLVRDAGGCRLADYHHRCPPDLHGGRGEILVFPAGRMDRRYIEKLARLDYGANSLGRAQHPFVDLLEQIQGELAPEWILVDARAGLGEVTGFLTGGLCHLYVLFGTLAEASWRGLELVLDRLGGQRLRSQGSQCECLIAAAMIPRLQEERYERSIAAFTDRASDVFSTSYYAESGERDSAWTVDDVASSSDAPHVPTGLFYDARLALFSDLEEVAANVLLQSGSPYEGLAERIRMSTEQLKEAGR